MKAPWMRSAWVSRTLSAWRVAASRDIRQPADDRAGKPADDERV